MITYLGLRSAYVSLLKEKVYWEDQNEMLKEKLEALQKNKKFYYEKLAREIFLKGKEGEEVILFVR